MIPCWIWLLQYRIYLKVHCQPDNPRYSPVSIKYIKDRWLFKCCTQGKKYHAMQLPTSQVFWRARSPWALQTHLTVVAVKQFPIPAQEWICGFEYVLENMMVKVEHVLDQTFHDLHMVALKPRGPNWPRFWKSGRSRSFQVLHNADWASSWLCSRFRP